MRFPFLLLVGLPFLGLGQAITHGPVVGGVGPDSARVFLRTDAPTGFTVEYSTDPGFATVLSVNGTTDPTRDTAATVNLAGLQTDTRYYYRVRIGGDVSPRTGSFLTFPAAGAVGNYRIMFGSCQNNTRKGPNDIPKGDTRPVPVYNAVVAQEPHLFLHLGDWAYPNNDWCLLDTCIPYTRTMALVEEAYQVRYDSARFPEQYPALTVTGWDYVYDDCDYLDGGSGSNWVHVKNSLNGLARDSVAQVPGFNRRNVIEAYHRYFPHYSLPDTAHGIYHKVTLGNVDIFVLDTRANMSPFTEGVEALPDGTIAYTEPTTGRTCLGAVQKQWLFDELQASTADWKVLVSSFTFNKSHSELLNTALSLQSIGLPGLDITDLALKLIELWPGFAAERQEIIDFARDNNIRNVLVISGDTHVGAIDDGQGAGFPEIMSSNISVSTDPFLVFFPNTWNKCRQGAAGVPNVNTLGLLETYGPDSLRMVLLDENNAELCSHTLVAEKATARPGAETPGTLQLYPNPAGDVLTVAWPTPDRTTPVTVEIADFAGRILEVQTLAADAFPKATLEVGHLPRGFVGIRVQQGDRWAGKIVQLD